MENVSRKEFDELKAEFHKLAFKIDHNAGPEDMLSIVSFSGTLDKLLATFIIATGAAAMGMKVNLFFTFWATSALKKENPPTIKKNFMEKMFGLMLPRGPKKLPLTQLNMAGIGPILIRDMMKKKNTPSLEELIVVAKELGVQINICEMSMNLMGIDPKEIIEYPNLCFCGVAKFLEQSSRGKMTLFI